MSASLSDRSENNSRVLRRGTESSPASERDRLLMILRSIGEGVICTDVNGRVELLNEVAQHLTGWNGEEAAGIPIEELFRLIDAESRKDLGTPARHALADGVAVSLPDNSLLVDRRGRERSVAGACFPLKNSSKAVTGAVLVFRDNTESQRMIENMIKVEKLESIGILAGGIAHDFNNLLGGIFGYVSLAREYIASDNKAFTFLSKALNAFTRASDLTKQLLTFSKADAPVKRTMPIGPILHEMAQFALSGSNIRCSFSIPSELWMCDIDKNQIGQVVDNIVINAKHAMPQGGDLAICAENCVLADNDAVPIPKGEYVKISIKDRGVGIPREHLSKIFDPFFTTKQKGTGLGLATCFSIVQKHNGFIDVESELGRGSTFFIYLPASKSPQFADPGEGRIELKGKGRILVMDGEEFIREITKEMLKLLGYETVLAGSGEEALLLVKDSVAERKHYDAVILDLTITGAMGGKQTAAMLGAIDPDAKAIVSSGYSNDPVMIDPKAFGFFDKIKKPYLKDDLARVLHRVMNHAS